LSGDDTPGNVRRLCAKARHPLRDDLAESLGVANLGLTVGAVCVYHELVKTAVEALDGSGIPVAAVSTGCGGSGGDLVGTVTGHDDYRPKARGAQLADLIAQECLGAVLVRPGQQRLERPQSAGFTGSEDDRSHAGVRGSGSEVRDGSRYILAVLQRPASDHAT